MIQVRQVTFAEVEDQWREMENSSAVPTVFQTFDWLQCWSEFLDRTGNMFILAVYEGDAVLGIAPLFFRRFSLKGLPLFRILHIAGAPESDYQSLILRNGREEETLAALVRHIAKLRWDIAWFSDLYPETPTDLLLTGFLRREKFSILKKKHTPCPFIQLPDTFENYRKTLSKNARQNTTKFCNRVERLGSVSYDKISRTEDIPSAMREFMRLHEQQWQTRGQTGALNTPEVRSFHVAVAQRLERYLDLRQLKIDEKLVASTYSYDFHGKRGLYLPGLDMEYRYYSLGHVMITYGIRDAIENGMEEYDFMRGDEKYKYHFTKVERYNSALYFSRNKMKFDIFKLLERTSI